MLGFRKDKVSLQTEDLPSPYCSELDDAPLSLSFDVSPGGGVAYCREKLALGPDEVIHRSLGSIPGPDFMGNLEILQKKKEHV